ncbi:GrpB family protein [Mammaliicoccus sp. G-M28]|uniref:GrpB family protein n=1 Tax=Mammaliicoccus sp. G-M28 TaxID=2898688 RepID=UPI001EFB8859|nr:GrpB family protein [Mammaliicoccus sp. G-M28]
MKITIEPHNSNLANIYAKEANKISQIFGKDLVDIYHIGSTAIPGIKAKPIIDILPVVKDINKVDQYNSYFENIDYEVLGEFGIKNRRYFTKSDKVTKERLFHVHTFDIYNQFDINRHLAFKAYLIEHPDVAKQYSNLKEALFVKFNGDKENYINGKDSFILFKSFSSNNLASIVII